MAWRTDTETTSATRNMNVGLAFFDGDTRTLTIPNPKTNLTKTEIEAVDTIIKTDNLILGDKANAGFSKINSAKIIEKNSVKITFKDS